MRILQVLHGPADARTGGTGVVVGALVRGLRAQGHEVRTLAPAGGDLGVRLPAVGLAQTWRQDAVRPVLRRQIRAFSPALVHVHHTSGLPLDLDVLAPELPVVWTFHDYSLACARGQLVDRWERACVGPSGAACSRCLAPRVGGRHAVRVRALSARLAMARATAQRAAVRLAPSRHLGARMAALGFGPVRHCPLPVERGLAVAPPPGQGPLRVLFLGSLLPTKGVHLLLAAAEQVPGLQLRLVGPCPDWPDRPGWRAAVREQATRVGAELRGPCTRSELAGVLAESDVLVLPSIWHENSPLTVREATAAGLRTVLPRVGGARELDPLARLIDNGDLGALVTALRAEQAQGRGRRAPLRWPTPAAHADWMVREIYGPVVARQTAAG